MKALEAKILIDVVRHVNICAFRGFICAEGALFVRLFLVIVVCKAGGLPRCPDEDMTTRLLNEDVPD
jgi:hypothetical protein